MPFHLSHPEDRDRILSEGIHASADGCIDLFTDDLVANTIARDQLAIDRYSLFWVSPKGITAELQPRDDCGVTSRYQVRIQQSRIDEQFIRLMGEHDVVTDRPTSWDYHFWSRRGFRMPDVNEQFALLARYTSGELTLEETNARLALLSARVNARFVVRRRPIAPWMKRVTPNAK